MVEVLLHDGNLLENETDFLWGSESINSVPAADISGTCSAPTNPPSCNNDVECFSSQALTLGSILNSWPEDSGVWWYKGL